MENEYKFKLHIKYQKHQHWLTNEYSRRQEYFHILIAIERNFNIFKYIRNQTDDLNFRAVSVYKNNIMFVKNQSLRVCMAAIKQNGNLIRYVKRQTEKQCIEAVRKMGTDAMRYIKNKTKKVRLEAMRRDCSIMMYTETFVVW